MNELLAKILDAHGGMDRWNGYKRVDATIVSGGGMFPFKGAPQDPSPRRMTAWGTGFVHKGLCLANELEHSPRSNSYMDDRKKRVLASIFPMRCHDLSTTRLTGPRALV